MAIILIFGFSSVDSASVKLTTNTTTSVEKFGSKERPGLLLKFELPPELQNARVDLALLQFKVNSDTTQTVTGLFVRPMLAPWASGLNLPTLPDSTASPFHINFGRIGFKEGTAKVEITQAVKVWQTGELPNLGLLIYPAEGKPNLQPKNLPEGGVAELEIFYTPEEKK